MPIFARHLLQAARFGCSGSLNYTMLCNNPSAPTVLPHLLLPSSVKVGRTWSKSGPRFPRVWSDVWSTLAELGRTRQTNGRNPPTLAEINLDDVEVGPNYQSWQTVAPTYGQTWPTRNPIWAMSPKFGRSGPTIGPTLAELCQIWSKFGRVWLNFGPSWARGG